MIRAVRQPTATVLAVILRLADYLAGVEPMAAARSAIGQFMVMRPGLAMIAAAAVVLAMAAVSQTARGDGVKGVSCNTLGTLCEKTVTVKSAGTVVLASGITALRSSSDCKLSPPTVDLLVKPHAGRVIPRVVETLVAKVDDIGRPTKGCAGHRIPGVKLTYHANGAAQGEDLVEVRITLSEMKNSLLFKNSFRMRYHIKFEGH